MAFALTTFDNPFSAQGWTASVTKQYADLNSGAIAAYDLTATTWQAVRVLVHVKTPPSATNVITATLQAGTGASCTLPVNIAQRTVTMLSGDTDIDFQMHGIYPIGYFRSLILTVTTSANSITYDAQVEVC